MAGLSAATALYAEPLVNFPSGPAAWTVECRGSLPPPDPGQDQAAQAVTLNKVEASQDGEKQRILTRWSNGRTRENWSLSGLGVTLSESPGGKTFVSMEKAPFDPSAFTWIKKEFLQGEVPVSYKGKKCWHYKGKVAKFNFLNGESDGTVVCEAWIDAENLLPVALHDGEMLGVFNFTTFDGNLTLPEKFKKRLDYYKTVMGVP